MWHQVQMAGPFWAAQSLGETGFTSNQCLPSAILWQTTRESLNYASLALGQQKVRQSAEWQACYFFFFLFFFTFFFRRNFCHGILDIVIMLIIKISRVLHLILGLRALSKSARLYRTTAQQQPQEHKRMWRHPTRVQYNNNESETDRRRESLYKEESCLNSSCSMCGQQDGTFSHSALRGKETAFEGLLEWDFWLWIPNFKRKFVPDHNASV